MILWLDSPAFRGIITRRVSEESTCGESLAEMPGVEGRGGTERDGSAPPERVEEPPKTLGKTQATGDVPPYVPPSAPIAGDQDDAEAGYFPLHDFQLDAFEIQKHPEQVGAFRIAREPTGAYDGKVYPTIDSGFAYVMGWLYGHRSALQEGAGAG